MGKLPEPTARDRGVMRAVEIQRREDPKRWRAAVDAIADAEERAWAEDYLRGILERMKVIRSLTVADNRRR